MSSYRDLLVWQRSVELVTEIYRVTAFFPSDELYGLRSQLRRAAVSVPSNIAEGQGRCTKGDFRQFLGVARGSLLEVETQVHIGKRLGYLSAAQEKTVLAETREVFAMLTGLMDSILKPQRQAG